MFYDLLHSPDGIVADVRATAGRLVDQLGLIEPKESWYQTSECHGYEALFARVHGSRVLAPSRLEVIAPHDQRLPAVDTDIPAYIEEVSGLQGSRPMKTHATVLTSSSFSEVRDHLTRLGIRHRVDPPSDELGHERLWVGFAPDDGPHYLPDDDGGLMFEVIPTQCLGLPDAAASGDLSGIDLPPNGSMTRVAARSYLVGDLSALVATLEDRLAWPVERLEGSKGARRAVMAVNFPRSARFELCEPGWDRDAEGFYAAWGPGTFATRLAVQNLDAKVNELTERGIGFRRLSPRGGSTEIVRVDADVVPGFLFDFVDETAGN